MTSASSSSGSGRRNLAVYHVPPPPTGWEGADLVRIVDALGLGAAWLSTVRAGSVIALHLRADPADPWDLSMVADSDRPVLWIDDGRESWHLQHRDPIAATFVSRAGTACHHVAFDEGDLVIRLPAGREFTWTPVEGVMTHVTSDDPLEVRITRIGQ